MQIADVAWLIAYEFCLVRPDGVYDVPDRRTGRQGLLELQRLNPHRQWNFVEVIFCSFLISKLLLLYHIVYSSAVITHMLDVILFVIIWCYLVRCLTYYLSVNSRHVHFSDSGELFLFFLIFRRVFLGFSL